MSMPVFAAGSHIWGPSQNAMYNGQFNIQFLNNPTVDWEVTEPIQKGTTIKHLPTGHIWQLTHPIDHQTWAAQWPD